MIQCNYEGFQDPKGTDRNGAKLCLRDPFPSNDSPCIDGVGDSCDERAIYRVFARKRGKKGNIGVKTCVEDTGTEVEFCGMGATIEFGRKKATDVSQELLTLCYDSFGIGLFDELCVDEFEDLISCDEGEQYFWDVDNNGVRNAELRFYSQDYLNS